MKRKLVLWLLVFTLVLGLFKNFTPRAESSSPALGTYFMPFFNDWRNLIWSKTNVTAFYLDETPYFDPAEEQYSKNRWNLAYHALLCMYAYEYTGSIAYALESKFFVDNLLLYTDSDGSLIIYPYTTPNPTSGTFFADTALYMTSLRLYEHGFGSEYYNYAINFADTFMSMAYVNNATDLSWHFLWNDNTTQTNRPNPNTSAMWYMAYLTYKGYRDYSSDLPKAFNWIERALITEGLWNGVYKVQFDASVGDLHYSSLTIFWLLDTFYYNQFTTSETMQTRYLGTLNFSGIDYFKNYDSELNGATTAMALINTLTPSTRGRADLNATLRDGFSSTIYMTEHSSPLTNIRERSRLLQIVEMLLILGEFYDKTIDTTTTGSYESYGTRYRLMGTSNVERYAYMDINIINWHKPYVSGLTTPIFWNPDPGESSDFNLIIPSYNGTHWTWNYSTPTQTNVTMNAFDSHILIEKASNGTIRWYSKALPGSGVIIYLMWLDGSTSLWFNGTDDSGLGNQTNYAVTNPFAIIYESSTLYLEIGVLSVDTVANLTVWNGTETGDDLAKMEIRFNTIRYEAWKGYLYAHPNYKTEYNSYVYAGLQKVSYGEDYFDGWKLDVSTPGDLTKRFKQQDSLYLYTIGDYNVTSSSYASNILNFTINGVSGTSITNVYCGDNGEPTSVSGATSWSYNSGTSIATINILHSSEEEVTIDWTHPVSTALTDAAVAGAQLLSIVLIMGMLYTTFKVEDWKKRLIIVTGGSLLLILTLTFAVVVSNL